MNAFMMLQAVLAAAPTSPLDVGLFVAIWGAFVSIILLVFGPAWTWAIFGLLAGAIHCFFGYRYLFLSIVMQLIACGGIALLFIILALPSGAWAMLSILGCAVVVMLLLLAFYRYFPALLGFTWAMGLAAAIMMGVGIRPRFLWLLPLGILGAWAAWKRKRAAYIWLCATMGAQALRWSVITLARTWAFGSFPVFPRTARAIQAQGASALDLYEVSGALRTWNTVMFVVLVLIGLWVQFRYADRWDYGARGRPGKAPRDEEIPSIFPGADTESHTGYGYIERPAEGTDKVEAPAEDPGSPS